MKKTYLISGIVALTVLVTSAGAISTVMAADGASTTGFFGKFLGKQHQVLTDAQKAEMKTKTDAVKAALAANDYKTWVAAEKAVNANSPLLTKITADNFSQYVQARNLQKQAEDIMTKLGIGRGNDMGGFGRGMMGNFGRCGHGGTGGSNCQNANNISGTSVNN